MKIQSISIKRFRSIMNLSLTIDDLSHYTTICGANNSGKTNVLRAIELFFKTNKYEPELDCPNHKFYGSRGQSVYPEITLTFQDGSDRYILKKQFDLNGIKSFTGKKNSDILTEDKINSFLSKIAFFYIPAININFPELINELIEEIYDIEYSNARFSGLKGELKAAFEDYIKGTLEILNNLATDINPVFQEFNENWEVGFEFSSDIKKFRDIISNDIEFYFNDKTNRNIDSKGSGLQRLGYILMYSKLIQRIKNKSTIILIDEPDIYLHEGLQIKLKLHLLNLTEKAQVFLTTHSKTFIDSYQLRNTFLLDIRIDEAIHYKRAGKDFYPVNTILIDLEESGGNRKIKEYLGIEPEENDILQDYNILVEGGCDKKFLTEFGNFFSISIPNIISTNGVTNFEKYIEFYNSFYTSKPNKPKLLVLYDNDEAGREVFKQITKRVDKGHFSQIEIISQFIPNFLGETPVISDVINNRVSQNFEIEDFVYPEIITYLVNEILNAGGYNTLNVKHVVTKIKSNSFKNKGILYVLEMMKNEANLENGHLISIGTPSMKKSIAERFNIEGNKKMVKLLVDCSTRYNHLKINLEKILIN